MVSVLFSPAVFAQGSKAGKNAEPRVHPRRAVVLTTDAGADMDDQWTLAQLTLAPEIDLRGVVTTHAPSLAAPAAETAARIANEVLDHLPLRSPARRPFVIAGSSVPLKSKTQPNANAGVRFLLEQSRGYTPRRRLGVLVTGAATDVASALLIDRTFADRIEIIAMGFERWPDGGDVWNVKNDIKAWQVLLESRAPIVVGDAAVTKRDLMITRQGAHHLFDSHGPAGHYLANLHTAWLNKEADLCQKVTGSRDKWPIWDQVVVAYLLGMTKSRIYPRPVLLDDLRFAHRSLSSISPTADEIRKHFAAQRQAIKWVTAIDARRLWKHFATNLEQSTRWQRAAQTMHPTEWIVRWDTNAFLNY